MAQRLQRDMPTFAGYGFIGVWAFFLYFVGPATPIIAEQLAVDDALAALTGTALAGGLVGSGFVGPRLIENVGRRRATVLVLVGMVITALLLAVAPGLPVILVAVLICATCGAILANMASAVLAERHGPLGATALTEANAVAAWIGLFAPAAIGLVVGLGWGWRPAAVVVAGIAGLMVARAITMSPADFQETSPEAGKQDSSPSTQPAMDAAAAGQDSATPSGRMGRSFNMALLAVVAAAASEFSLNFWGAVLLVERVGIDLAVATAAMSLLVGGVALGRTLGARVTYFFHPKQILLMGFGITFAAFVLLVWSQALWLSLLALLLTGMGLAMLFPLAQALAISNSQGRTDKATAYVSMSVGLAIGVAPFLLGALVGVFGVVLAFMVVPVAIIVGVAAVLLSSGPEPTVQPGDSVSI